MKKYNLKKYVNAGFGTNTIGAILLAVVVHFNCTAWGIYQLSQTTTDPNAVAGTYRVFVTSISTLGNMNFNNAYASCPGTGIANANCICEQVAISAGITTPTTTYRAWLSQNWTAPGWAAICNIQGITGTSTCGNMVAGYSYINMAGQAVFNSWDEIASGFSPLNSIQYDQTGIMSGFSNTWTGSSANGYFTGSDCMGWTDTGGANNGTVGSIFSITTMWSDNAAPMTCNTMNSFPIYCFEGPL